MPAIYIVLPGAIRATPYLRAISLFDNLQISEGEVSSSDTNSAALFVILIYLVDKNRKRVSPTAALSGDQVSRSSIPYEHRSIVWSFFFNNVSRVKFTTWRRNFADMFSKGF